jgi:hypothetical protein
MEFKGYRNPNGNYITVAEQKKQYNRYKKDLKQARKEREQENEQKDQLYFAMVRDEKKEEQKAVEQEQLFIQQAKQFISHAAETLPYKEYLVAWDIANRNRIQIEADIFNKKITLEQVRKVFTLAQNYIDNLTDKIYMKDLLTT